jgi:cellobiose phosphorylase
LGVRPEAGGLRIDPCIPKTWPGFTMRRRFRGKNVFIEVRNPSGVCQGVKNLTIDGEKVAGCVIPAEQLRDDSRVTVVLG